MFDTIEDAILDLKSGKPIIVVDDEDRENEGDFVALSEKATPDIINFMITYGKGLVCTSITENLAEKLNLTMMADKNTDPFGTAFTVSVDHKQTTTGISAYERSMTIKSLLDPAAKAADFKRPGHVFPLIAKERGVLERPGHTEASVDLAILSDAYPSSVICEIINEDGTMARVPDLVKLANTFNLKLITIADLISYRKKHEIHIKREIETTLPTQFGEFKVFGYSNTVDNKEHIAFVKGDISNSKETPVLTRIHSECLTGDVFSSYRCDCGPQLLKALEKIEREGRGVLLYMRQEGRGIGLLNKLRAYHLQDQGFDTAEANEELGFPADAREYHLAAQMLRDLTIDSINLLTNNPEKLAELGEHGIHINERLPIEIPIRTENEHYMKVKSKKFGHILSL